MISGFSDFLNDDPTEWLLEEDNPPVRYVTMKTIVEAPDDHPLVQTARREMMKADPIASILANQHEDGYWVKPGAGYSPKYTSTVWQIILLAQLGADPSDPRIVRGCDYLLNNSRTKRGAFSASQALVPSAAVDCLNGNLLYALLQLGLGEDRRVQEALKQLCLSVTTRGFECGANARMPCAWGAVKSLRALTVVSREERTDDVTEAIRVASDFLLSRNLVVADYPCDVRVSSNWHKFGFPMSYVSNVLEALQALAEAGRGADPRLTDALKLLLSKQDEWGRWKMEYSLNGKMWVDIEKKGRPSKWVTLHALQTLKRVYGGY